MDEQGTDVWHQLVSDKGKTYYYNRAKGITQWDKPQGYIIDVNAQVEEEHGMKRQSLTEKLKAAGTRIKNTTSTKLMASPIKEHQQPPKQPTPQQEDAKKVSDGGKKKSPRKRVWEKRSTETFGIANSGSDFYYINTETGETQWQRPADYASDDEIEREEETGEMCFDPHGTVSEILAELGATSDEIVQDRREMLISGVDKDRKCGKRLRQIFLAVKYCGALNDWEDAVARNDYQLVRNIYLHWGPANKTPKEVRALTCILLETFMKLDSALIRYYCDGDWGLDPVDFLQNIELGLQEATPDEKSTFSWLSLLYNFLSQVPTLPREALPGKDTIRLLVSCMAAKDEDVFLMATYVILALNSHFGFTESGIEEEIGPDGEEDMKITLNEEPNPVVAVLDKDKKNGELFSEATLHLLNGQSCPYDDPILLGQLLYMIRCLFSTKKTKSFFHMNDLKVMVDIIILQLKDLPLDDDFRADYIRILHLILLNSQWKSYRRVDILESLDFVLSAAEKGMDHTAVKAATKILLECAYQLQ